MKIKSITTIVKKADECIVYHDDGMFCSWTDKQKFSLDLLNNVKTGADGLVMLVTEEEAQNFSGEHMKFGNHNCWTISKDIFWILEGRFEPNEREAKLIKFIKEHLI